MTVTLLRTNLEDWNQKLYTIKNILLKTFSNDNFRQYLFSKLSLENLSTNYCGLEKFLRVCIDALDDIAPRKKKYTRGNNMPFISKSLTVFI